MKKKGGRLTILVQKVVEIMMCITLRIIAGVSYLVVDWPYGVEGSTVYIIFEEILEALNNALSSILFPKSPAECLHETQKFSVLRKIPLHGFLAALDGIDIYIKQSSLYNAPDPRKYFKRKGFYAIAVQAAVSAD